MNVFILQPQYCSSLFFILVDNLYLPAEHMRFTMQFQVNVAIQQPYKIWKDFMQPEVVSRESRVYWVSAFWMPEAEPALCVSGMFKLTDTSGARLFLMSPWQGYSICKRLLFSQSFTTIPNLSNSYNAVKNH